MPIMNSIEVYFLGLINRCGKALTVLITEFVIRGPSGIMYLKRNQNKVY